MSTTVRLPTRITGHTLVGGTDNPNCFSLGDVRIVNMKMGPFERVVAQLRAGDVEITLLTPHVGLITDSRFPEAELHNARWCRVCCPFHLLPPDQQREHLRTNTPFISNGRLQSWCWQAGVVNSEADIDRWLNELRALQVEQREGQ